jgi:hypothetical protein
LGAASGGLFICDNAGDSITISTTGTVTCVGTCTTTIGPYSPAGEVLWGGKLGPFSINLAIGQTKPSLPGAETNVSLMVSTAAKGGTLTVEWTDTGFTGPTSTATMSVANTIAGSVLASYTGHTDSNNVAFGTGGTVGTLGPFSATTGGSLAGPGPTGGTFSLTTVINATMAPASALGVAGDSLHVASVNAI